MKQTQTLTAGLLAVSLVATFSAHGQLVQSTFDSNRDGWLVVDRSSGTLRQVGGTRTPSFIATGGNPGGFIQASDLTGTSDWYWHAPAKFLGNKSNVYGGRLEIDLKSDLHDTPGSNPFPVILVGGGVTNFASRWMPITNANVWTHRSIVLVAGSNWTNAATGRPATEAQMIAALAALEVLDIRGEYATGGDTGGLDNVMLFAACPQSAIRVSEVEVCWPSVSNALYRVDYRLAFPTNPWLPFTNVVGNGDVMCVSDRSVRGQPQRFYRVVCP